MKHLLLILAAIFAFSCISRPKNFSYHYEDINTGLNKMIDIDGYYVSPRGCDSTFYTMYMFYPNGLFTIASTSRILPELIDCFENGGTTTICNYPIWGIYKIEDNIIKTQTIGLEGTGLTYFRDYKILPDGNIVNISDYVDAKYTNLGYMKDYPSFKDNSCEKAAKFYPLTTKRDSTECPFFRKKWFRNADKLK